jgi:hypothetical protein
MIAPTPRPGHLAEIVMDDDGVLLVCDSRADLIFQFDARKRELIKSWPVRGDGAGDMALDRVQHRLFVGTRTPPEMTVYDSLSGTEIQSLPAPATMDGVHYDARLKRIYVTGGRWYGTPEASAGWLYVYQQKDPNHYDVIGKSKPALVRALRSLYPNLIAFMWRLRRSATQRPRYSFLSPSNEHYNFSCR